MKEVIVTLRFNVPDFWKFDKIMEVVLGIAKAARLEAEDVDVVNVGIDHDEEEE